MTDHPHPNDLPDPALPDPVLDALLAQARTLTPEDSGAAGRFLTAHRARQEAARQQRARTRRAGWVSAALASAAVVAGLTVLRPAPALPSSAAYDAYQSAWGEGW
ncbi:hypothetical protein GCM10008959_32220 [Deinococcus seoulensis]|uniref:DUF3619 family protein n=1 Tax=Deinococcus seoulensis TaxID=1837379 RepID=A0ABQ2RUF2_9DEIO|nr:hypothetical protein [Deinococcus seoulensis]GGR67640.1 hypothetical protein GCM10008959_32220 [Deinococcus seoulensis]